MSGKRSGPASEDLAPQDRALWDEIKKTVKPLRKPRPAQAEAVSVSLRPKKESAPAAGAKRQASAPPTKDAPKPPPLAPLDRRTKSRVARGRVEIDARLDLHGMTLERARPRLAAFLGQAQARGHALVLVITGKGSGGRGALRHEVPHWLALPALRPFVIGFEEASPNHGGAGALYVRIRRRRD